MKRMSTRSDATLISDGMDIKMVEMRSCNSFACCVRRKARKDTSAAKARNSSGGRTSKWLEMKSSTDSWLTRAKHTRSPSNRHHSSLRPRARCNAVNMAGQCPSRATVTRHRMVWHRQGHSDTRSVHT